MHLCGMDFSQQKWQLSEDDYGCHELGIARFNNETLPILRKMALEHCDFNSKGSPACDNLRYEYWVVRLDIKNSVLECQKQHRARYGSALRGTQEQK